MRNRSIFLIAGVFALGAILWWFSNKGGSKPTSNPHELVIALGQGPATLDPIKAMDTGSGAFLTILHAPLVIRGKDGNIKPILAESATMSSDGRKCEIVIREGATFWGGSPVTSADVSYSLTRFYLSKHPFSWSVSRIEGIESAGNDSAAEVAGLVELSDRKLEIRFSQPDPDFLQFIATPLNSIIKKGSAEGKGQPFDTNAEGAGPFKPVSMEPGKSFTFERNLGFPIPSNITRVEVKIVENPQRQLELAERGEVDLVRLSGPMILEATDFESEGKSASPKKKFPGKFLNSAPTNEIVFVLLNTRKGPFATMGTEGRRAFVTELHRRAGGAESLERLYGPYAEPVAGVSPRIPWSDTRESVWEKPDTSIKANLLASNEPDARRLAALIQGHASESGVQFAANFLDPAELVGKAIEGEPDATLFWIQVQPAHEAVPWTSFFDAAGFAVLGEAIPYVASEVSRIRGIEDDGERKNEYERLIRKISSEQTAWIPLASRQTVYLVPSKLKGDLFDWNGIANFYEVRFAQE